MKEDQRQFLTLLGRPPFRLTPEQTAWILNCTEHDIPVLVGARLLKPLGDPAPNGAKYFSTAEVLKLADDPSWLVRMTKAVQGYWRGKNDRKLHLDMPIARNSFVKSRRAATG